jgi:hypothetical protein
VTPDFQPDLFAVEELLNRRYYLIPRFQRPYSWDDGNLDDFWRDALEDNAAGYFVGPMVGWRKSPTSPFAYVVDGQQRLTTITLLLTILRGEFARLGEDKLARGVHRLVERPDRDSEERFVLQPEAGDSTYLNNGILSETPDRTAVPSGAKDAAIEEAHKWLRARVQRVLAPPGEPAPKKAAAVAALKSMRDRLLALRVIWVEHGNEDDAYVVFETLNSRGKDLAVADLLKNHLLNRIRTKNTSADAARDRWDAMRRRLDEANPPIDADRYIQHWWLSSEDYTAQRKLFKAIRTNVRTKDQAKARLDSICADAPLYRLIWEPGSAPWPPEALALHDALVALRVFGVTQPAPLLLAALRARRDGGVKLTQLRPTFQAIERFHFQVNTIAARSSSGGISAMYAGHARRLTRATSAQDRAKVLTDFRAGLANGAAERDVFIAAFPERLVLTDVLTRDKRLVRYALRTMHEASRAHRPARPTVEHLLSQEQISTGIPASIVGQIGNLLWVDEDLNGKLANKTFVEKKKVLAKEKASYDFADILDEDEWGADQIIARGQRLAAKAYDDVWKLPV